VTVYGFVADQTPLDLLRDLQKQAHREARDAGFQATTNSLAHYVFGFMGVAGGAIAAATASDGPTWIPIVAGVCAAIGSALSTLFRFEGRAKGHEKNRLLFRPVADYAASELALAQANNETPNQIGDRVAAVQAKLNDARSKKL
jgi:hypothetical protein